jgi:hypothetical protein
MARCIPRPSLIAVTLFPLVASLAVAGAENSAAAAPEIWFSPVQESLNPSGPGVVYSKFDFPQMIADESLWKVAESRIAVLALNVIHIAEHYPDAKSVVNWTNMRGFKIEAGASLVNTGTAVAGGGPACLHPGTEGLTGDTRFDFEAEAYFALHQWKQLGGRLDILSMDGPFFFGYYAAKKYCNYSIRQVAVRTAVTVNKILEDYPDAQIVDAEGPGPIPIPQFLADYKAYLTAFNAVSRRPITHWAMDMHWNDAWHSGYNWVDGTRQIIDFAHANNLRAGLLMNADDRFNESADGKVATTTPATNQSWMQMVRGHMELAHAQKLPLDFIEINSWMKFPERNLPESDPQAFTALINDAYRIWHSN